jgi:hypothetical protein
MADFSTAAWIARGSLRFRLVDEHGEIRLEQAVDAAGPVEAVAGYAGDRANELAAEGHVVRLEVMDPAGDLFPAGEWQLVATVHQGHRGVDPW